MTQQNDKTVDRRTVRTKRAIKNAFARLLTEQEISDITVAAVADFADINRKTFYNYYDGIHELVDEIENEVVCAFESILSDADFINNMKNPYIFFEKLTGIINTDMDFYGSLLSMNGNFGLSRKIANLLKERIKTLITTHMRVDENDLDIMLDFLLSGLISVYQSWFNSDRSTSLEEVSAKISKLSFSGINAYLNLNL